MFFVIIGNRLEYQKATLSSFPSSHTLFCHLKNLCTSLQFPTYFLFLFIFILQKQQQNHYF